MIIAGWVISCLAILVGAIWCAVAISNRDLSRADADLMARDGKLEGEPEFMRDFRVVRARGDALDTERHVTIGMVIVSIGLGVLLALAARGFLTGTWFY